MGSKYNSGTDLCEKLGKQKIAEEWNLDFHSIQGLFEQDFKNTRDKLVFSVQPLKYQALIGPYNSGRTKLQWR